MWSSGFWRPAPVFSEQDVCKDSELAHDGGDGDLGRLSAGNEGLILGFHVRIESDCDQCWHIECLPQVSASGADEALAAMLT